MNKPALIATVFGAFAAAAILPLPATAGVDTAARAAAPIAGAVIPGASILSARVATLVPAQGGKQTQSSSFGERMKAGLDQAGGAVAHGAALAPLKAKHDTVKSSIGKADNAMPNRISMNVTIARQRLRVDFDGEPAEAEVGADGNLAGVAVAR